MNLQMGSHFFADVEIPILWGSRAIVQDRKERISVIDLAGQSPRLEILGDEPAPGVEFAPIVDGSIIMVEGVRLYSYHTDQRRLESISLDLPDCTISESGIVIGTNRFSGNLVSGYAIGIAVSERGIAMGAPMPAGLAQLVI